MEYQENSPQDSQKKNPKTNLIIGAVIVVIIIIVLVVIARRSSNTSPKNVERSADSAVSEDTEMVLPNTFPQEVPLYANTRLVSASDQVQNNTRYFSVTFNTTDDKSSVSSFFQEAFTKNGWTLKSTRVISGYTIIQGIHDGIKASLQIIPQSDIGSVNIVMVVQEPV